jgi:hypothetical protein
MSDVFLNPPNVNKEEIDKFFKTISAPAPIMQGGHPLSYITVPIDSLLSPYNTANYNFPTKQLDNTQYINVGNGLYTTQHIKDSINAEGKIGVKPFSIGLRNFNPTSS